jgi:hypothetical protein
MVATDLYTQRQQTCTACKGIAYTGSFDMGLTSAEELKLDCFKETTHVGYYENLVNLLCSNGKMLFNVAQIISMCMI